jgi:hypothetical protein
MNHSVCWADDIHPANKKRDHFKACIIDDVLYNSVAQASREHGLIDTSLCHALDVKETFKGHSISWADE